MRKAHRTSRCPTKGCRNILGSEISPSHGVPPTARVAWHSQQTRSDVASAGHLSSMNSYNMLVCKADRALLWEGSLV